MRKSTRHVLAAALLLALLLVALRRGWFDPARSVLLRATSPLIGGSASAAHGAWETLQSFARIRALGRTVRVLEEENVRLQSAVTKMEALERENRTLREQLALLPRAQYALVTAEVISRSTDGVRDALIVNRGSQEGIRPGMPVIVNDGVVVGRVADAEARSAVVVLLTDASFRLAAETAGTGAEGVVRGARGLDVRMEAIPKTAEVRSGDRVVTTGSDGTFPQGFLIGTVRSVEASDTDIFQEARVAPILDVRRIRVVSIVTR